MTNNRDDLEYLNPLFHYWHDVKGLLGWAAAIGVVWFSFGLGAGFLIWGQS